MKLLAITLVLVAACSKDKEAPPAASETPTPTQKAPPAAEPSAKPALPDQPAAADERPHHDRMNADTDGDGKVSDEERAAAVKQRATKMHERLDKNGDGKLTLDELDDSPRRGMHFDATIDTNKDGEISADELAAAMEARRAQWRGQHGSATGSGSDQGM